MEERANHTGENDGFARQREPMFNLHPIIVLLIVLCAGVHVLRVYIFPLEWDIGTIFRFAFIPVRWSGSEPLDIFAMISPVTYSFLHGDFVHLAVNMVWLAAFGTPLANRIGSLNFVLFWIVTAAFAAGFFFLFHADEFITMVGASGSISAMMAAAARFGFQTSGGGKARRFGGPPLPLPMMLRHRTVIAFIAVWFVINLISGYGVFDPGGEARIAWEAHIGGFLAGFFLVSLFREKN